MGADPDWTTLLESPYIQYEADSVPEYAYVPCIRRDEKEGDNLSPDEEQLLMEKQVIDSKGFDIDFKKFRCIFNYKPIDFNHKDNFIQPEITNRELMDMLSRVSLEGYNEKKETKYEYVKVVKANFHNTAAPARMYFITFQGKEPSSSDDQPKTFQAKACYYCFDPPTCVYCILKPEKQDKEDPKKTRLEPSNLVTQDVDASTPEV